MSEREALLAPLIRFGRALPVPFSVLDADGRSVWCNQAYSELVGLDFQAVMARPVDEAVHPEDLARYQEVFDRTVEDGQQGIEVELRTLHASGRWLTVIWNLRHDPEADLVVAVAMNVTDQRRQARALRHEATHDALTGLANRPHVMATLERLAAEPAGVAVALVDLDGFKVVNDRMGHRTGDALLGEVAAALRRLAPADALVGRIGGDEFVVLVPGGGPGAAEALADRLRALSGPVEVLGRRVQLSGSIGVTAGVGVDPDELLHEADEAVYTAKARGPGRTLVYGARLRERDRQRAALERTIAAALEGDGIDLHLQPVVCVADDALVGVEALARIVRAGTTVPAEEFQHVAERMGVMGAVSRRVRAAALAAARALPRDIRLHVNVDADDLLDDAGLGGVVDEAVAAGVDPRRLVLELSEALVLRDVELAAGQLAGVRELGARVAIDGFGAGASSLVRLGALPIDVLKVDRRFTIAARTNPAAEAIVAAVAGLRAPLGLEVVVEGVEEPQDLRRARELGVTAVQGHLVGPPVPAAELLAQVGDRG